MPNREYLKQEPPRPRVQVEPKKVLANFGLQALKAKFYPINDPGGDFPVATSEMGTPVFSNIGFLDGSFTNLEGERVEYEYLEINTVLFTVNQSKNIIKTPIQGRNGTVKEYISDGDFDISIRGLIVSSNPNRYPKEDVNKLMKILTVQDSLEITSPFLLRLGITNIVIESYSLPESEGFQNIQAFEINAVSDEPIEISTKTR